MATAILDSESGVTGGNATVNYSGILTDLAAGDTVGITVGGVARLQTVPAGGQTLYQALTDLGVIIAASGTEGAKVSRNSDYDQCLHVQGLAGTSVVVTSPVYAVA